jgi:hypothetical protein
MLIRRFTFTIATLVTFIFALLYQGMFLNDKTISRETSAVLSSGASQDGMIALSEISATPPVPMNKKIANQARTLRAYFSENTKGDIGLYLESVSPHEYYLISGGFLVTREYETISWLSNSTLQFNARVEDGILVRTTFDIATMSALLEPIDEFALPDEEFEESIGAIDVP